MYKEYTLYIRPGTQLLQTSCRRKAKLLAKNKFFRK